MRWIPQRFSTYRHQPATGGRAVRGSRRNRAPLTAPRRSPLRQTPAWSPRAQAERRPLRRVQRCTGHW